MPRGTAPRTTTAFTRRAATTLVAGGTWLVLVSALAILPPRVAVHALAVAAHLVAGFAIARQGAFRIVTAVGLSLVGTVLAVWFSYAPVRVEGASMEPAFTSGQLVLAHRWRMRLGLHRGDAVVFVSPEAPYRLVLKRVVATGGDEVRYDRAGLRINAGTVLGVHQPMTPTAFHTLSSSEVFVLGDNHRASRDSRSFGPVPDDRVLGVVIE